MIVTVPIDGCTVIFAKGREEESLPRGPGLDSIEVADFMSAKERLTAVRHAL